MASNFENRQAQIDRLFEQSETRESPRLKERLLAIANRGIDTPETLSHLEISQVCYALAALYSKNE